MIDSLINETLLSQSLTYTSYRELIDSLFEQGKVTGTYQSASMLNYTKMNLTRMKRHEKTTVVPESLVRVTRGLSRKLILLTLTEGWCGDAAQSLPVLQKICETSDNLEMRLLLRDEHPEVMDAYLTNGARSIPKVVGLDAATLEEVFVWGPRPLPAARLREEMLRDGADGNTIAEAIHKWYAADKNNSLFAEFEAILKEA